MEPLPSPFSAAASGRDRLFSSPPQQSACAVVRVPSGVEPSPRGGGAARATVQALLEPTTRPRAGPVKWVAVALMCLCTIAPSLSLWLASWSTGQQALSTVQDLAQSSLETAAAQMQTTLAIGVRAYLETVVSRAEGLATSTVSLVQCSGLLDLPGAQARANISTLLPFRSSLLYAIRANQWMLMLTLSVSQPSNSSQPPSSELPADYHRISVTRLNVDV
eukprot:RCo033126